MKLEIEFLKLINFELVVHESKFNEYANKIAQISSKLKQNKLDNIFDLFWVWNGF